MRLCERTLEEAQLRKRISAVGSLGGRSEAFQPRGRMFRASVLCGDGGFTMGEKGASDKSVLRLLAPADLEAEPGDGVWLKEGMMRILSVQRWTAHVELVCEELR